MNETKAEHGKLSLSSKHRLSPLGDEATPGRLSDCINMMCGRAESVLLIVSGQFESEDTDKWNSEITWRAIESVINEIRDINEVVESYYNATRQCGSEKSETTSPPKAA